MPQHIKKQYLTTCVSLILLFMLSALLTCSSSEVIQEAVNLKILKHQMTVQNFGSDKPSSVAVVSGMASNEGSRVIETASVSVIFYNNDDEIVDTASATTSNLAPGAIWNFSIQSSGTEAWKIIKYDISTQATK